MRLEPAALILRVKELVCPKDSVPLANNLYVPILSIDYSAPDNLPPKVPGTYYIVSRLVADMAPPDRDDLVYPYELVRNDAKQIIGCRSFARFNHIRALNAQPSNHTNNKEAAIAKTNCAQLSQPLAS